jgi:hypothetical protein
MRSPLTLPPAALLGEELPPLSLSFIDACGNAVTTAHKAPWNLKLQVAAADAEGNPKRCKELRVLSGGQKLGPEGICISGIRIVGRDAGALHGEGGGRVLGVGVGAVKIER